MKRALRSAQFLRRSRVMWTSPRIWKPRLVFWSGAVAIGCVSVLFAFLADQVQHLFGRLFLPTQTPSYAVLAVTPLGFVLSAWMAYTLFPGSQGSGIPQCMAARHLSEEADRRRLLSLRLAAGKVVLTLLGLASGASIGREGPTVQVGASIMLQAASFGGMSRARGLILAGSAAGIAAAFNTPLAGIVFAIEEMGRAYEARINGLVLSAVIIAGLAALALIGDYSYFGVLHGQITQPIEWASVFLCGIGGGALGAVFSALTIRVTKRIRRSMTDRPLRRTLLVALACGVSVAAIGLLSDGQTFGTGYEQARGAVEGTPLPPAYFLEKLAASLLSTASGIPGGIFAPSLSVGAGIGSTIGLLLGVSIGTAAVLGMAGYFAGVVQAPMTAFVIVLEMTGNQANVIPLMLAATLGYGTARLISREPLYHALSRLFIADALRRRRSETAAGRDEPIRR